MRKWLAAGALALSGLMSFSASAITIPFALSGGWMQGTETQTQPFGPGQISFIETDGSIPGAFHEMRWGVASAAGNGQRSGLRIDNQSGFITSDGTPVLLSTLTHFNNVIQSGTSSLLSVVLRSQLQLGLLGSLTDFTVNFKETPNAAPCASPTPNGSVCDDFFTLVGGLPSVTFNIGSHQYRLDIFLVPDEGVTIIDGIIYTREGGENRLFTYGRLVEIAEPETLALLGFGLLAFGLVRRRA
ncbi:MAG: THxN family PEP-CTERM protein [Gammaproteobacteria bacterium]|nr:THxN family PEP-CTERM protein [Gammaproteobacteria bacterium]